MTKIKQLFCDHTWKDITTKENIKAGIAHWQCTKCKEIASLWETAEDL